MISYQWDAQDRMLKLRDELRSAGFKVWMDVDKMGKETCAVFDLIENKLCNARDYAINVTFVSKCAVLGTLPCFTNNSISTKSGFRPFWN